MFNVVARRDNSRRKKTVRTSSSKLEKPSGLIRARTWVSRWLTLNNLKQKEYFQALDFFD